MTSSLVGSEMCIRDRWKGGLCVLRSSAGDPWHGWDARTRAGSVAESVSYTHLTLPTICSV
eukprot:11996672-Prorocentrum_lima.AAC.1